MPDRTPTDRLESMEQRLLRLENKVFGEAPETVPPPVVTTPIPPKSEPTPQPPVVVSPKPEPTPDSSAPNPDSTAPNPDASKPQPKPDPTPAKPPFEINVGKVLNVAGVAFLIVGAAFLLMYSWEYLGSWFKLGAGLAVSAFMVTFGERLSRRETNKWYGQGVMAGGWSLAYFVVYAMQNIASVKVLDSVLIDCTLLVALAAGCMTQAVRKRSEVMAILSTLLAFLTISLSTVTAFSVLAFAVLVIGVAAVIVRMKWLGVLVCSAIGSYVTFAFFTEPQILAGSGSPEAGLGLAAAFLALFWLAHNAVAYILGERDKQPGLVSGVLVINAVAFVGLGLWALGDAGFEGFRYLFLFVTGLVYLGVTPMFSRRGELMPIVTSLIGLVCATAALPLKLNPESTTAVWLIESALLVWAGLRFNLISFRWFATVVSAIAGLLTVNAITTEVAGHAKLVQLVGFTVEWRAVLGVIAAIAFGTSSYLYSLPRFAGVLRKYEAAFWHQMYFVAAAVVLWMLPTVTAGDATRPLYWLIEGSVLLFISRSSKDVIKHGATAIFFGSALYGLVTAYAVINPWLALGLIAFTALAGLSYRFDDGRQISIGQRFTAQRAYLIAVMAASVMYTSQYLGFANASTVLAFEVAAFVAAAVALRDRVLLTAALAGFGVVGVATAYNQPNWTWLNVVPVAAIAYAASALSGRISARGGLKGADFGGFEWTASKDESAIVRSVFGVAASALLAIVFATLLSGPWISVAWALQGVLLIGIGFRFDEEWYRTCGLGIFAMLAGKVLFFDLSDAPTIQRILSFIITGVAFLVGSYAYAWFRKNAKATNKAA